jgi:hypothetical protein
LLSNTKFKTICPSGLYSPSKAFAQLGSVLLLTKWLINQNFFKNKQADDSKSLEIT